MRTQTMLWIAGAVICTSTGGAVYENRAMRRAQNTLEAAVQQRRSLQHTLRQAKTQIADVAGQASSVEEQRTKLQRQIDEVLAEPTSAVAVGSAGSPVKAKVIDQMELIATNPEYQKMYLDAQRRSQRTYYARLYKNLGLTPQQIDSFEDLLIARAQSSFDLAASSYSQGLKPTDPAFRKIKNPAAVELTAKIKELLGDAGYKEFNAFPRTMGGPSARGAANELMARLFFSETPLTVDQSDKLIRIVDAHCTVKNRQLEVNWAPVYVEAQGILLPAQLDELKYERESARLYQQMREVAEKAAKAQP